MLCTDRRSKSGSQALHYLFMKRPAGKLATGVLPWGVPKGWTEWDWAVDDSSSGVSWRNIGPRRESKSALLPVDLGPLVV